MSFVSGKPEKVFIAHINEASGARQTVKEHSVNTAQLCYQYAIPELKDFMYAMGLLHDIGKFQAAFQRRINGENIRVEHSTCGALAAQKKYSNPMALMMEYCIAGHHSGIPDGGDMPDTADMQTLFGRLKRGFEDFSIYQEELPDANPDPARFLQFLVKDCDKDVSRLIDIFSFLTRYSFSCLIDADFVDTSSFCALDTEQKLTADFSSCLKRVNDKLESFVCTTVLQQSRAILQKQVFQKINNNAEVYLMNMPTGSGKTLCSVKFALERVLKGKKKRIIYVIPYNSIIDQTVSVLEELFQEDAEILRHQSSFSYEDTADIGEDYRNAAIRATENWDAPFIVTTAVQFFESIYANKRGKLCKLHNIADSILVFDEAHLMPQGYLQPFLQAIAYITRYLNSEAVFLTATMPDFSELIKRYALPDSRIESLITDTSSFHEFRKCNFKYLEQISVESLLGRALVAPSSLLIVNKRVTARKLYRLCESHCGKRYHLSTYMTAYDRQRVIAEIKAELTELEKDYPDYALVPQDRRIIIVSTSLIEAGVDLDVFAVFRELSGLDSILQAAGRCNREGKRTDAEVFVFDFEEDDLRAAPDVRSNLMKGLLNRNVDISCPQYIAEYYESLFFIKHEEIQKNTMSKRCQNIVSIPFRQYAADFELIDTKTVSLVVARDEKSQKMVEALRFTGASSGRRLQKYVCSVYQRELEDLQHQHVVDDYGSGIWCLTNPDYYDENIGVLFEAKDYYIL